MEWKVYKITSPKGRVYVGCTELDLDTRFNNGRGYHHNKEFWNDIVLYGWNNFQREIIAEYPQEHEAREREHLEIRKYPDGYNIYRGMKGYVPTGNPKTPAKSVVCIETQIEYPSAYRASKETGIPKNKILEICNGKIRSYHKTHWKFAESH